MSEEWTLEEYHEYLRTGSLPGVKQTKMNQPKVGKFDSDAERQLFEQITAFGLPAPVVNYEFHPDRGFRFDGAWPDRKIAYEVQGGIWTGGKHGRGAGIAKDFEKLNEAILLGWRVFQFETGEISNGRAAVLLSRVLR